MPPAGTVENFRANDVEGAAAFFGSDDLARDRVRAEIRQLMAENVSFLRDEFQIEVSAIEFLIERSVLQQLKKREAQSVVFVFPSRLRYQRHVTLT
ncbi:MAG TPA: hypothetical protein VGQ46_17255 [Thermoanaerobaculia bacterium]|nr:hypothetical protein [Thermoanaerobaculia bacterium]